jgi:penicillin-binding protein 1A
LFGKSPNITELNNPDLAVTSELYSADGKLIGKYYDDNRIPVKYEDISPILIKTLIATEDVRYYKHHGIDIRSSASVFWYMIKGKKRGGSTITQQLVKNLYKTRSNYSRGLLGRIPILRTIIYKTKELDNALKIELFYSKEEILTMYLNTVDFGSNSFGIHTAARTYFNTTPAQLTAPQCATLIGMLKAPTSYSPVLNPKRSLERRNVVLKLALENGVFSQEDYNQYIKMPLEVEYTPESNNSGSSCYFRDAVARNLEGWLEENGYDLYRDGLKIYTTVDSRMQQYAEEAVQSRMKILQRSFSQLFKNKVPWSDEHGNEMPSFLDNVLKQDRYFLKLQKKYASSPDSINFYLNKKHKVSVFTYNGVRDTTFSHIDSIKYYNGLLHASFIAMDPENGYVKCWVGDINYDYFKYDHVEQAKRQPGSTFKTFLYTAAIDNGYGPCDKMVNVPVSINYEENGEQKTWSPGNASGVFTGDTVTLKYAYARSINSIAAQVTKQIGWDKVIQYAHNMGIKSELKSVPSISFGSSDVSLFELVNAFCPIMNGGNRVKPILVTRIEDRDGKVIAEFKAEPTKVLSEETSFLMQQMLRGGMTEPGATTQALFSWDLFRSKIEFGGKTGTSQNLSDGWFVGVTPKLIGGAWVGGEYRCVHFKSNSQGEGCKTALPIFGSFMERVLKDQNFDYLKVAYPKAKGKISKNYMCHTYLPRVDTTKRDSAAVEIDEEAGLE